MQNENCPLFFAFFLPASFSALTQNLWLIFSLMMRQRRPCAEFTPCWIYCDYELPTGKNSPCHLLSNNCKQGVGITLRGYNSSCCLKLQKCDSTSCNFEHPYGNSVLVSSWSTQFCSALIWTFYNLTGPSATVCFPCSLLGKLIAHSCLWLTYYSACRVFLNNLLR